MRCELVRPLLPELADGPLREAGEAEAHLAGCAACTAELDRYRSLVAQLGDLRTVTFEPPAGLADRIVRAADEPQWRSYVLRVTGDERVQHAALSLGGAVVGATAIGLLWWRAAHRALRPVAATGAASQPVTG